LGIGALFGIDLIKVARVFRKKRGWNLWKIDHQKEPSVLGPYRRSVNMLVGVLFIWAKVPQVFRNPGGSPALQKSKTLRAFPSE